MALRNPQSSGGGGGSTSASDLTSGTLNDARLSGDVTVQGNAFNGSGQLIKRASSQPAVGTVTITDTPEVGQYVLLGDDYFIWRATRNSAFKVTISSTPSVAATNLAFAINTDLASKFSAVASGNTVTVTCRIAGSAGNQIVFTTDATGLALDGPGTLGGTTAGTDGGLPGVVLKRLSADSVKSSDDSLASIPELTLAIAAGETWHITYRLRFRPGGGGIQWHVSAGGLVALQHTLVTSDQGGGPTVAGVTYVNNEDLTGSYATEVSGNYGFAEISFLCSSALVAATVNLLWAQAVSDPSDTTLLSGSGLCAIRA